MAMAEIEPPKIDDRSPVAWVKHIDVSRKKRWVTGSSKKKPTNVTLFFGGV